MVTSLYGDRACHGEELAVLFGTLPSPQERIPPPTGYEVNFGKYIRGAWAAIAKDPEHGLRCYGGKDGWPVYHPQTASLIRLSAKTGSFLSTAHWDMKGCFFGIGLGSRTGCRTGHSFIGRFYSSDNSVPVKLELLILMEDL
jgi:hypothetical protein